MALSEHEQRMLDELERHLYEHDADVVPTVEEDAPSLSTRSVVLTMLAIAVGLGVIVAGIAFQLPLLGVLGFALMVVGVSVALSGRSKRSGDDGSADPLAPGPRSDGGSAAASTPKRTTPKAARPSFMDRLDERWDRRQQGDL